MELTEYIIIALKIIVGLSILNVWLLQAHKPTKWRGGNNIESIIEEFEVYGLSKQFCYVVGFLKISFACLLIASVKFEYLTLIGSIGL
ncbi:MAG: DoxX family protein, partial [Polaribacter sp.]